MADEEIMYLSPEEELTSVRERLRRIQAKSIILVIPTQTQLRSHVSWRLIHTLVRELEKEILIISSDRQIRSVVKAAGFKVADSLESSATGSRTRPPSRPGRMALGGRTATRSRTPPGKSLPEQQRDRPGVRSPYQAPQRHNEPGMQLGQKTRRDDAYAEEEDTLELAHPAPATFGKDDQEFDTGHDYRTGSSASRRPVGPPYEDEEPDHEREDYWQSQRIRQSAASAQKNDTQAKMPPEHVAPVEAIPPISDLPSTPHDTEEPFTYLEEEQSTPLREQQAGIPPMASMPINEIDDKVGNRGWKAVNPPDMVPDISDHPTDNLEIFDDGDQGDFVDRSGSSSPALDAPAPGEGQESGPSLVHGVLPRANRTGKSLSSQPQSDIDDDNALPPISAQQPQVSPRPATRRPSGTLPEEQVKSPSPAGIGNRSPQPVTLAPSRNQAKTAQPPLKKKPARERTPTRAMPRPSKPLAGTPTQRAGQKRGRSGIAVPLFIVIFGLLILGLLALFVPSADVTVTLPSHSFPLPMKLTATASSRQDVAHRTLPAQMLVFNSSVTGPGHATGTTLVGTKAATGIVTFTNTGTNPIVIPTGTIVTTQSGVQFVTTAEALVSTSPNNTNIAPIQAQNPGATGNVPANSINTIPSSSNPGLNTAVLTVTNSNPTTGGGAGNATSVSPSDVNAEKVALDIQLQAQIKDFLKKNVHAGDQQGKLLETETPVTTPAVDKIVTDGTFTETLKLNMKVLVVRSADLQAAATAQLKDALSRQRTSLALVPQQQVELKQVKPQPSKDGATLTISLTAVGQVAPQISEDTVRSLISGKSIEEAKLALVGRNGIPNVVAPQITVYPGLIPWLPFWQPRINVHFKTIPARQTPVPKHGKS